MGFMPTVLGHNILSNTFRAGPSTGILPFRVVVLDNVATENFGNKMIAPVRHPATTFANGDKAVGVVLGPAIEEVLASNSAKPVSTWAALKAIAQNRSVEVRLEGVVPILCDDTTDSTAINAGDGVRMSTSTTTTISSQTVTMAGCVAKAAMTSNAYDANQHVVGIAYNRVNPASDKGQYALVKLQPAEY